MCDDLTPDSIQMKQCKRCEAWKPLADFHVSTRCRDGREGKCRVCRAKQRKEVPSPPLPDGLKLCHKCKTIKPATPEYFVRCKSKRDGLGNPCKACRAKHQQSLNFVYKEPDDPSLIPLKLCRKCFVEYPRTPKYFFRNRTNSDGLGKYCKACDIASALRFNVGEKARARKTRWREKNPEYGREYFQAHADKLIEYNRRYRAQTPDQQNRYTKTYRAKKPWVARAAKLRRRARERALPNTLTSEQWQSTIDYFKGCCAYCGRPAGLFHTLAMDHFVPLSAPNSPGTTILNCVPACHGKEGCNNSKNNTPAATWLTTRFGPKKAAAILARIEAYFASVRDG